MMTWPSTVRLTLMPDASLSRSPVAPDCRCRSLPAQVVRHSAARIPWLHHPCLLLAPRRNAHCSSAEDRPPALCLKDTPSGWTSDSLAVQCRDHNCFPQICAGRYLQHFKVGAVGMPARSTRFSRELSRCVMPDSSVVLHSRMQVKTLWLRLESAFIIVSPILRFIWPRSSSSDTSRTARGAAEPRRTDEQGTARPRCKPGDGPSEV